MVSNLNQFNWITHGDMEFELVLKGPFWVEISSNEESQPQISATEGDDC